MPGCVSAGDTFEQAIDNAAEALGGHLALLRVDGDPIPQPRSIEQLRTDRSLSQTLPTRWWPLSGLRQRGRRPSDDQVPG